MTPGKPSRARRRERKTSQAPPRKASLEAVLERLRWAKDEFASLQAEIDAWMKVDANCTFDTYSEFHPEAGILVIRAKYEGVPPLRWGVRASNILHQSRAALDGLVWE